MINFKELSIYLFCQFTIEYLMGYNVLYSHSQTEQPALYSINGMKRHLFTLERNVDNVLYIELIPVGVLSNKLRIRFGVR